MNMPIYPTYAVAIDALIKRFSISARKVHTQHWQGVDVSKKPEMATYEMLHPSFHVQMTGYDGDLEAVQAHVGANQPWATDHFKERVCGYPINPGVEWANWPYGKSASTFLEEGKFNHNYMERYWPKYAGNLNVGIPTNTREEWKQAFEERKRDLEDWTPPGKVTLELMAHTGIKYKYGDLMDVVTLLAHDPLTRQAYLPVWFPEDTGGGDKRAPCTLGYHFIMRNGYLDVTYYIRSCDLVRHFRDDVFLTHALVAWVWSHCRALNPDVWNKVELGRFVMHITSLHVFANDWPILFPDLAPPK